MVPAVVGRQGSPALRTEIAGPGTQDLVDMARRTNRARGQV
ncbi:hypothetical protein [Nocardia carnea]|uniref:Uncharacterized protein n=1 Tax=Nocardia carnea TaxID=37328 RepID=A0ABW7TPR4_9NOCA|nr:hypothetical protein [Nocardia carnea]